LRAAARVRRARPGPHLGAARPRPHRRPPSRASRRRGRRPRLAGRPLPQPPLVGRVDPRPLGGGRAADRPRRLTQPHQGGTLPITASVSKVLPDDVEAVAVGAVKGAPVGGGVDEAFLAAQGFEAARGDVRALPGADGRPTYVVGLGPAEEVDAAVLRHAAGSLARAAKRHASLAVDLAGHATPDVSAPQAAQAIVEGLVLGGYTYGAFKSDPKPAALERVVVVAGGAGRTQAAIDRGLAIAEAVCWVRDLVNEPGGSLTPTKLAQQAVKVGERAGFEVTVWTEKEIKAERLGGLLGVNRGSEQKPRFLQLRYEPEKPRGTVALVGKGITFDSGGLSLKPADAMAGMKGDMGGAGAVLGAFRAIAAVGAKVR